MGATSIVNKVLLHVPFARDESARYLEVDGSGLILVPKSFEDITVFLSAHISIDDGYVKISLRRSFTEDFDEILDHERLAGSCMYLFKVSSFLVSSPKKLKTLTRFIKNAAYRDKILNKIRDSESEVVLASILDKLPGPPHRSEITCDELTVYVVDTRTVGSDTIVYTSNIFWCHHTGCIVIKTWRAFETLFIEALEENNYDPWLFSTHSVDADEYQWNYVATKLLEQGSP